MPIPLIFAKGIQAILQRPMRGGLTCQRFGQIPIPNPAFIVMLPAGGPQAERDAEPAALALFRALRGLSTSTQSLPPPCAPRAKAPLAARPSRSHPAVGCLSGKL